MSLKSKLKVESMGIFAASIFYAIVGVVFFVELIIANYPPHIGIIGIFSLITAYGLFRKRVWALWLVVALFFIATTFSVITIYSIMGNDLILSIGTIAYLILTWVFTIYTATKRKTLEG